MAKANLKPKPITKRLIAVLPERAREVVISRFGLGADTQKMTLEAIGKRYGITRERVRQIENYALATIRKSDAYGKEEEVFEELKAMIGDLGGVVSEAELLISISKDASTQNHIHFILVLGDLFKQRKEDSSFQHRWFLEESHVTAVEESLKKLYSNISDDDLIPESDMVESFFEHMKDMSEEFRNEEIARRWLNLSKNLGKNKLGEWGNAQSPNIRAKRMRDYAFLVIRRHGSPMHFTEVAESITSVFDKEAHVATCHNELIKDKRFVLVGRGLYALAEWGHASGVVKDVIAEVLEKNGPLTREEIVDKVLRERYVKENTIVVNLQNSDLFKKDKQGRYTLSK
ncbi:hypothetical protein COB55_01235 [Candidatus Wolfebacteria bacterium]|nr:MAG: hypothetical protein COB55_01235 [Candidatus Wolfebacteria bacterium]